MRAVRIPFDFCERVMLTVHRDPFPRTQAGRNPQTEAKDKRDRRMQLERLVRGAAVKKDSGTEDGDLSDESGCEEATSELPEHGDSLPHHPLRRSNSRMKPVSASTPSSGNAL